MSIEAVLEKLVNSIPKSIGAIMVDWEGEAVLDYCHCDPYEIKFIAAHKVIILDAFREVHKNGTVPDQVEEIVISSSGVHLIIGSIDSDYALVLGIDRSCPLSIARRRFREALAEIRKEV